MILSVLEFLVGGWVGRSDTNIRAVTCIRVRIFYGSRVADVCDVSWSFGDALQLLETETPSFFMEPTTEELGQKVATWCGA